MRVIACVALFILVCLMGLFVSMAGGVVWGSFEAGSAALMTLAVAAFATGALFFNWTFIR